MVQFRRSYCSKKIVARRKKRERVIQLDMEINEITGEIIDASIKIHKILGPGLLESVYEEVLHYELTQRGILSQRQTPLPVVYETIKMDVGFRIDLLVEETVI